MSLSATLRSSSVSRARYTLDIPPVPTSSSSSYRPAISPPPVAGAVPPSGALRPQRCVQCVLPHRERFPELLVGAHERRQDAAAVRVDAGLAKQQPAARRLADDRRRERRRRAPQAQG